MKHIGFIAGSGLLLAGCGVFGTKDKGAQPIANDSGLLGSWGQKACLAQDWLGLTHVQDTLTFSVIGNFTKTTTIYSDAGCAAPSANLSVSGTFASLDNAVGVANARNINFTSTSAVVTPRSKDAVDAMNAAKYCGITNWQANGAADVTGKPCLAKTFNNGDVTFDIYQLSNSSNHLEFGRASFWLDKSDAGARPTALEDNAAFDRL